MPGKALLVASSYYGPIYPDGKNTGVHFSELLTPYEVFRQAGLDVDITSEKGTCHFDDNSVDESKLPEHVKNVLHDKSHEFWTAIKNMKRAADVDYSEYNIYFVAGGHAALFDLPGAIDLQAIAAQIYKNGGVIAAVCHGPCILPFISDLTRNNASSIVEGRNVTAFNKAGEESMNMLDIMQKKNLETMNDAFRKAGAKFIDPASPNDDFVQSDSRVVTGVNPQSAASTAKAALQALKA
ncbi:ThiJ domain-containing protein [Schizosaccharomyces cryophilus OY26]|uniref:D-lactate dehydratase n=1 Tax=Schizosaccharomyces cryophilus (strain OY26 / ATCC MYA-4695 / CBS 11777 / NBRC 106824 / NRRL Y48691) TaxID=653667 RepID=S9XHY3_SCHCR|nr:ThiJ domain-containing protein [Schizosaccharomyces cryophilus OY26]EPY53301.1 ThiJ domain-containing protein [Schizosaccharomyces cryophilus OY26]